MKKEGIDPDSAKGSKLIAGSIREIGKACRIVMSKNNLDSVWKKITNKSGKSPKDITNEVIKLL
jgi:Skp family chaperone for outer membrane proteins